MISWKEYGILSDHVLMGPSKNHVFKIITEEDTLGTCVFGIHVGTPYSAQLLIVISLRELFF
jgi:hypothetical protein